MCIISTVNVLKSGSEKSYYAKFLCVVANSATAIICADITTILCEEKIRFIMLITL